MLVELTVQSAAPGRLAEVVAGFRDAWRPTVEREGARLLFAGSSDSGTLNELVVAWSHDSLAHWDACRLAADAGWMRDRRRGALRQQTRDLIETTAFSTPAPPPAGTTLIELRSYRFLPGALAQFLPICEAHGLDRQRRHCGHDVFHGVALTGSPDRLLQAWAYADPADHERGQFALFADAAWAVDYRQRVIDLVDAQEHRFLRLLR